LLPFVGPAANTAGAAGDATPVVSVTPSSGIHDGDTVTVNIKATDPLHVHTALARLCRAGVQYQGSTQNQPANDFRQGGPNCPLTAVSTSGDASVIDNDTFVYAPQPGGESFQFRVGSGTVKWNDFRTPDVENTLACDSDHACVLVIELLVGVTDASPVWQPFPVPITYAVGDPLAGCGGPAAGALTAGASDRMTDAWINWTIADCKLPGRTGATSRTSFVGEGEAVDQFALGSLDFAYTAGGYDDAMALSEAIDPAAPDGGRRKAVAVPVAVNAAVIGVGGGYFANGKKAPFREIRVPVTQLAKMFGGGPNNITPTDISNTNAGLGAGGVFNVAGAFQVAGFPEAEAFSWYMTRLFDSLAPADWKVPDLPTAGAARNLPRGNNAALALADPSFATFVDLLSGRPTIRKSLFSLSVSQGGAWLLTDRASARSFNMEPVEMPNADGEFVPATPETLRAGLATMSEDPQGVLISDPTATAKQNGVTPYPATMVEYALVPAEPLLNDDCSARASSQQLLTQWLTYITSAEGQSALPAGFVPLTPELQAQAAARIAEVGAAPTTGACAAEAPVDTPAPTVDSPTTTPAVTTPTMPASSSAPTSPSRRQSSSSSPTPTTAPAEVQSTESSSGTNTAELVATPAYRGQGSPSSVGSVLALIGIVLLGSAAAFATSKTR
jgi:hypothetical protein